MMDRWLFTWSLTMDGNFQINHLKMRNPSDNVCLSSGTAFIVDDVHYKAHLDMAINVKKMSLSYCSGSAESIERSPAEVQLP